MLNFEKVDVIATVGVARDAKGPFPQISSISCHFVFRDVVSQTKYCCSLKFKIFTPKKTLGWIRYWLQLTLTVNQTPTREKTIARGRQCFNGQGANGGWTGDALSDDIDCNIYAQESSSS